MASIQITPDQDHPLPYDMSPDKTASVLEEMAVAGNTAELQEAMGAQLQITPDEQEAQRKLLEELVTERKTKGLKTPSVALASAMFLREYGSQLAMDAAQIRAAITNKLMEIANCGDPRYELKALELLGKHSDIGLFTERSEITVTYKDPSDLENAIKERVKRLLNANIIDVNPLTDSLDDELGIIKPPARLDDEIIEDTDEVEYIDRP